jgi:hypothetical protein
MQIVGDKTDRVYRTGNKTFEITSGAVYEVDFRETYYENKWGAGTVVWLNAVRPAAPTDGAGLLDILRLVTSDTRAEAILQAVEARGIERTAPVAKLLEALSDRELLLSVTGVGSQTASKIMARLSKLSPTDMALAEVLSKWNIKVDRSTLKYRWTAHYYTVYPEGLDTLRHNPYEILSIASMERSQVRAAYRDLRWQDPESKRAPKPKGLAFQDVDGPVLALDSRWKTHRARLSQILETAFQRVSNDGHSVALLESIRREIQSQGVSAVRGLYDTHGVVITDKSTIDLSAPEADLTDEAIRDLVRDTGTLVNTTFLDADSQTQYGVTSRRIASWQQVIVKAVAQLSSQGSVFSPLKAQEMTDTALRSCPLDLTVEQKQAIGFAFGSRFSAVVGGAGTGKTSVAQAILNGYLKATRRDYTVDPISGSVKETPPFSLYIVAPTGVAAQRIRLGLDLRDPVTGEAVIPNKISWSEDDDEFAARGEKGRTCIGTLHSFLGYNGHSFSPPTPHPAIIFLDEASMVDEEPMSYLMSYVSEAHEAGIPTVLMLSGDANQLPPVGVGFPFRDLLGGRFGAVVPTTELTVVQRQATGSMIVHAADQVKQARLPPTVQDLEAWNEQPYELDYLWVEPEAPSQIEALLGLYRKFLGCHKLTDWGKVMPEEEDIQVVLPLRNPSKIEADALYVNKVNEDLQKHFAALRGEPLLTFVAEPVGEKDRAYRVEFALGDKVLHTGSNGYGADRHEPIMRGSMGRITAVTDQNAIEVTYPWMDTPVVYGQRDEIGQISLAYAITGHASQGSEFDFVLMVLPDRAGPGLVDRSWLYTAMTRAKRHLFMVSSKRRVAKAVSFSQGLARNTLLSKEFVRTL